jgi:hypothetical protein
MIRALLPHARKAPGITWTVTPPVAGRDGVADAQPARARAAMAPAVAARQARRVLATGGSALWAAGPRAVPA